MLKNFSSYSIIKKLKGNIDRLKFGKSVICNIKGIFDDIKRTIPEYSINLNDSEEIKRFENINQDAKKNVNFLNYF